MAHNSCTSAVANNLLQETGDFRYRTVNFNLNYRCILNGAVFHIKEVDVQSFFHFIVNNSVRFRTPSSTVTICWSTRYCSGGIVFYL